MFDQVVLMARKRSQIRLDEQAETDIRRMATGPLEDMERLDEPVTELWKPAVSEHEKITFATPWELTRWLQPPEAMRTGLWANPAMQDRFWPAEKFTRRPLMPLRRGHMAMLMAAGFLDNLCLENDEERVLVKGEDGQGRWS